ncbi:hypothetical protein MLD38_025399 [Melastoma candidum]|uniref:Uncharacterized protein n=1 Tax=Melastoma candidum TaxID=119954 RepID=A0ACB9NYD2_9MYRT|nr:hypothetical protein MLD38_025399 [Melastoma candidum]
MAPFEAIYRRSCKSALCWNERDRTFNGPKLIRKTSEVVATVRQRTRTAQSRQKSYADKRRRPLEFEIGNEVFLKLSPMKSIYRMGKAHKLSPRYIGPYKIIGRIGKVTYRVAIPP